MKKLDKKMKIVLLVGYLLAAGILAAGTAVGTAFAAMPIGASLAEPVTQ
jgi:hypothetical protein